MASSVLTEDPLPYPPSESPWTPFLDTWSGEGPPPWVAPSLLRGSWNGRPGRDCDVAIAIDLNFWPNQVQNICDTLWQRLFDRSS